MFYLLITFLSVYWMLQEDYVHNFISNWIKKHKFSLKSYLLRNMQLLLLFHRVLNYKFQPHKMIIMQNIKVYGNINHLIE